MYKVCRHIRTSGGRCRSAALASQNFCYYHLTQRQQSITLDLPPLEDRTSIQIAISRVLASLAAGMIDRRDAGMYLYGIQIAAANMRRDRDQLFPDNDVRSVVLTRENDQIAPPRTVFEERDLNNHKKSCKCDDCTYTETDNPHHPNCRCGQCHFYAEEEAKAAPTVAVDKIAAEEPSAPDFVEEATNENGDAALLTLQATAEAPADNKTAVILTLPATKGKDLPLSRQSHERIESTTHPATPLLTPSERHLQLHPGKTIIYGNV